MHVSIFITVVILLTFCDIILNYCICDISRCDTLCLQFLFLYNISKCDKAYIFFMFNYLNIILRQDFQLNSFPFSFQSTFFLHFRTRTGVHEHYINILWNTIKIVIGKIKRWFKYVRSTSFWKTLHHVRVDSKDWKVKEFKCI